MSSPSRSPNSSPRSPEDHSPHPATQETLTENIKTSDESSSSHAESSNGQSSTNGTSSASPDGSDEHDGSDDVATAAGIHKQGEWQAIWSQDHNAYYFFNASTNETTWSNPLASAATAPQETPVQQHDLGYDPVAAAIAAGVDPELAYLDPNLKLGGIITGEGSFQAKFNARTGAFTRPDGRDPTHLGEWERMQRMSSVYFDTAAYEREVQKRKEEDEAIGKKKKKVTKKDLDRFKEQKRLKKIAKTAWLRT